MGSADTSPPLPLATSPDLILTVPTPTERIECFKINGIAWQGPLSTDQYLRRENHLHSQDMTKDGLLTCWILTDRTLPPDNRPILGACESIAKNAFLAYDGKVEEVVSHGIGSVFCRGEYRGRGYAKRMIAELAKVLDTWQQEKTARKKTVFSVLYSDIGKSFYAAHGWKPFPSSHFALEPLSKSQTPRGLDMSLVKDMVADDVKKYMCSDAVIERYREILRESTKGGQKPKVAFRPDAEHMVWHWAREEFYVQALFPEKVEMLKTKGAGVPSRNVFFCWTRNFAEAKKDRVLYILRTLYEEPSSPIERKATVEAAAAVLRRAQFEAHKWDMDHVELWNPTPLIEEAVRMLDPNAELVHRESSSIPSLKWNGKEFGLGDDVEWCWNEKYAWC